MIGIRSCAALLLASVPLISQETAIDAQRSTIVIHIGRAGLLSAAGHEHWVDAPIASGRIENSGALAVEFKVQSAKLTLRPDPRIDAKTQATIQKDMEEMTLETARYPEIAFRSTRVEKGSEHQFKVDGILTLHGISKRLSTDVKGEGDSYTGHTVIRQTDFGIKPISIGGGLIRIKDPVEIDFQIFGQSSRK